MRKVIKFSVVVLVVFLVAVVLAKPRAYVITGWYNQDEPVDKELQNDTAREAISRLVAAGYDVVTIYEATAKQFKDAVNDPCAKALVFIDHGAVGKERLWLRDPNGNPNGVTVDGNDLKDVYHNFKIVTIHACDQNQPTWINRFPDANFFAWTDCPSGMDVFVWQQMKTYPHANDANNTAGASSLKPNPFLTRGQFLKEGASGIVYPVHPISGNWPMSKELASAFGNQIYNFLVSDDNLANAKIIFGAAVSNGVIAEYAISDSNGYTNPDFEFTMTYGQFISAIENPYVLLDDNLLGSSIFIDDISGTGVSPSTLFAGVRRNIFFVTMSACEPVPDNGAYAVPIPVKLAWTTSGVSGITHDVYFGTVSADVNSSDRSGDVYKGNQAIATTTYTPNGILLDKRYYWRIDEVQSYPTLFKGDVWTFTTSPIFYADDFQAFASTVALKNAWKGTGTANNSLVYQDIDGTDKAVKFWYDNVTSPYYSGIKRSVAAAQGTSRDYTFGGSGKTLRVSYKADPNTNYVYMKLWSSASKSSKKVASVAGYEDGNWYGTWFKLNDFGTVATNVTAIEVGEGNDTIGSGQGFLYIDDIRVQATEYTSELLGDISVSHKVDYNDIDLLPDTWLAPQVNLVKNSGMNQGPSTVDPNWPKYWHLWNDAWASESAYVLHIDNADPTNLTKPCARLDLGGSTMMWNDGALCQTVDVCDYNGQELLVSFMHKGNITAPGDTAFEYRPVIDGCSTNDESGLPMLWRIQSGGSPSCDDCYGVLSWDWEPYTHVMTVNVAHLDYHGRNCRYLHLHFRLGSQATDEAEPEQYLKIDTVTVAPVGSTIPVGDINLDDKVDMADFAALANNWLKTQPSIP